MQRNAPTRGAVGTGSVVVSAGSVASGGRPAGKSDPSRGRGRRAGDRDDRGGLRGCARWRWRAARTERVARGGATRRRAIRVAAITRRADREEAIAAPTDFLAKRRVHDVGAAARSDWTRRVKPWHNRDDRLGPSEHRGGHRGPGGFSSRPSPQSAAARQPTSNPADFEGGARRQLLSERRCDRDRRRAPAWLFDGP